MTESAGGGAGASRFEQISELIRAQMAEQDVQPTFVSGQTRIPLSIPTYGPEEVIESLESLVSTWVTMGKKVSTFETAFSEYLGTQYGLMVNSGSSANLLALSILTNPTLANPIVAGDEIITPAVTWATTVFPILNVGALPVLVDVDPMTFNLDPDAVERAITPRTKAILLVHLLGNPCDMAALQDIARRHNLYLVEDACEAHGAEFKGQKVGSFGDLATFSFFFSHHISTVEGGMVLTSNEELAELGRALRVFGWVRDLKNRDELAQKYSDIDSRFLFVNSGFNLRPTEIQGAFGIHQLPKLEPFIEGRRSNAAYWTKELGALSDHLTLPTESPGTRHVWFGYPVTVKADAPFARRDLVNFLEARGLETRPVMAGNIAEQPVMQLYPHRIDGTLPNSRSITQHSFIIGNHHGIGPVQREAVVDYFREFFAEVG